MCSPQMHLFNGRKKGIIKLLVPVLERSLNLLWNHIYGQSVRAETRLWSVPEVSTPVNIQTAAFRGNGPFLHLLEPQQVICSLRGHCLYPLVRFRYFMLLIHRLNSSVQMCNRFQTHVRLNILNCSSGPFIFRDSHQKMSLRDFGMCQILVLLRFFNDVWKAEISLSKASFIQIKWMQIFLYTLKFNYDNSSRYLKNWGVISKNNHLEIWFQLDKLIHFSSA